MRTINWVLFTFFGILLFLFAMISSGQSASYERHKHPFDVQNAAIFNAPKIAKEECPMGTKWFDGKCRVWID